VALSQNYPNPFNPSTELGFQLPNSSHVTLDVFDVVGRDVAALVNDYRAPGSYTLTFDGSHLASGVYFLRLVAGKEIRQIKMLLLR
jgi:hypothetical protein